GGWLDEDECRGVWGCGGWWWAAGSAQCRARTSHTRPNHQIRDTPPGLPLRWAERRSAGVKPEKRGPPSRTAFTRVTAQRIRHARLPRGHYPGRGGTPKSAPGLHSPDLALTRPSPPS